MCKRALHETSPLASSTCPASCGEPRKIYGVAVAIMHTVSVTKQRVANQATARTRNTVWLARSLATGDHTPASISIAEVGCLVG